MIAGFYDNEGNYYTDLKQDEFYIPSWDYHVVTMAQKIPTVTTLYNIEQSCFKSIFLSYNKHVYVHHEDFFYMVRGTMIHERVYYAMPYKEFMLMMRFKNNVLVGTADGYNNSIGRIHELKTVGSIPKEVRPKDAYQVLTYHMMLRDCGLSSQDSEFLYVSFWKKKRRRKTMDELFDLIGIPGVADFKTLRSYIESSISLFNAIVEGRERGINTKHCLSCTFWNLCGDGKRTCIEYYKRTGKTQFNRPAWTPGNVKQKMQGDEIYRSQLYVQTLAILEQ